MCRECGCSMTEHEHSSYKTVQVLAKILDANDKQAQENRKHFEECGVYCINLMSSPGAGKTTLLEKTIDILGKDFRIGVIEGDLETKRDTERIKARGAPAYQITTGSACHLDAFMVHEGMHNLPMEELDLVFVENVGNLVCPASYDVGAHLNVVLLSTTEGDDKPEKYPVMFKSVQLMVITKIDLLPFVDFSLERAINSAKKVNPRIDIIKLSAKTGEGMEDWIDYIRFKVKSFREVYEKNKAF